MTLPDKQHYLNLGKGFAGEQQLDIWVEDFTNECLIVNDLLLKHKQQLFQIDTLLIFSKKINLFNVKYYEGDYYTEHDKWYVMPGKEVNDPFPEKKITTPAIFEWCALQGDKKKVARALASHYRRVGHGKYSHYTDQ